MTSRLFWSNSVWTPRRFHVSSTAAISYSHFPAGIAVRILLFGSLFEKFEDLSVVHVGDQVLRFFAELVDLLVCLKSWMNDSLYLWFSNFSIHSLTLYSRVVFCCSIAERSTPGILWSTVLLQIHHYVSNRLMFPKMILRLGFADLVDHIANSISARLVAHSEWSSSEVFTHSAFSMQAASSVL